jgi:hypothetical protein
MLNKNGNPFDLSIPHLDFTDEGGKITATLKESSQHYKKGVRFRAFAYKSDDLIKQQPAMDAICGQFYDKYIFSDIEL